MNEATLYTSFQVILEMLHDRGLNVDETRENYSPTELAKVFLSPAPASIVIDSGDKRVRLFYFTQQQLKKHLKSYILDEVSEIHMIVVSEKLNHASAKSLTDTYKQAKVKIQLFTIGEVMINISKHALVPKHELLTKEEEQKVLTQYMSTKTQLPWILRSDPMARYMGLEPGQIVRITTPSPTSGEYISYRTCV